MKSIFVKAPYPLDGGPHDLIVISYIIADDSVGTRKVAIFKIEVQMLIRPGPRNEKYTYAVYRLWECGDWKRVFSELPSFMTVQDAIDHAMKLF